MHWSSHTRTVNQEPFGQVDMGGRQGRQRRQKKDWIFKLVRVSNSIIFFFPFSLSGTSKREKTS
ncbi:hypothetical protein BDV26DRAFT_250773 [Aspergillus bertholletiae]|uniref:Uncharacterized protein n=1 Tax=Aspergillus bertholletiae TaxID=1226010 RepID=A0A5N7BPL1_9EURO|nr:hypothetical protein BDV26DRAFT_250773 [Aspergillus bertholletiae]